MKQPVVMIGSPYWLHHVDLTLCIWLPAILQSLCSVCLSFPLTTTITSFSSFLCENKLSEFNCFFIVVQVTFYSTTMQLWVQSELPYNNNFDSNNNRRCWNCSRVKPLGTTVETPFQRHFCASGEKAFLWTDETINRFLVFLLELFDDWMSWLMHWATLSNLL